MTTSRWIRAAVLTFWTLSAGCTTLRELPRADYGASPERKGVRIETRDGLVYEFDRATYDADSLTGYRLRSELEGPVDELAVVRIALDDVTRMRTRRVDWYRTGLVGGGVLAGVLAVGLAKAASNGGSSGSGGCPRCPD
ncbi:MAG: hypothetical protein IT347_00485 [Candidatus Eisenbacteria bacterium]|nr:hypothetical protein [Candidatus Eisenbacteria bacterium]